MFTLVNLKVKREINYKIFTEVFLEGHIIFEFCKSCFVEKCFISERYCIVFLNISLFVCLCPSSN